MASYLIHHRIVNLSLNHIEFEGRRIRLVNSESRILQLLLDAKGSMVTREVLLKNAWSDTIVTEASLLQSISMLRKKLGDSGKLQLVIITNENLGYSIDMKKVEFNEKPLSVSSNTSTPFINKLFLITHIFIGISVLAYGYMTITDTQPLKINTKSGVYLYHVVLNAKHVDALQLIADNINKEEQHKLFFNATSTSLVVSSNTSPGYTLILENWSSNLDTSIQKINEYIKEY
ncbi:winged helix-turn-helix domain-containing protein [Vibrio cyclitrophicus]